MQERERETLVTSSVLGLLFVAWLGFLLHRSPRFPGSGLGAVLGIAGAVLMLLPLAYLAAKRIDFVNSWLTQRFSMRTLMVVHVYAGILGPLLAILHTGHRFDSTLGIVLTSVMLLTVVSGFSVRYLLTFVTRDISEKLPMLQTARGDLDSAWGALEKAPPGSTPTVRAPLMAAAISSLGLSISSDPRVKEVMRIADGVADLEYSIALDEFFKRWFRRSLALHIVLSVVLYVLLALHIAAGLQYGLRWMS